MISSYQDTFAGAPWFESWSKTEVLDVLNNAYSQEGFCGKIILSSSNVEEILGFAFGYKVPSIDTKTVNFSKIYSMLKEVGKDNSIYLAECGIIQDYQAKGLGKILIDSLKQDAPDLILRTKNENMLKVLEKIYGKVEELFYDPIEIDRMWYGVSSK